MLQGGGQREARREAPIGVQTMVEEWNVPIHGAPIDAYPGIR